MNMYENINYYSGLSIDYSLFYYSGSRFIFYSFKSDTSTTITNFRSRTNITKFIFPPTISIVSKIHLRFSSRF